MRWNSRYPNFTVVTYPNSTLHSYMICMKKICLKAYLLEKNDLISFPFRNFPCNNKGSSSLPLFNSFKASEVYKKETHEGNKLKLRETINSKRFETTVIACIAPKTFKMYLTIRNMIQLVNLQITRLYCKLSETAKTFWSFGIWWFTMQAFFRLDYLFDYNCSCNRFKNNRSNNASEVFAIHSHCHNENLYF